MKILLLNRTVGVIRKGWNSTVNVFELKLKLLKILSFDTVLVINRYTSSRSEKLYLFYSCSDHFDDVQ